MAGPGPDPASYTFGDSRIAASRLELLQEVFGGASAGFIRGWRPLRVELAVDLGCGPGFTTRMVGSCCPGARVVGVDSSAAFVAHAGAAADLEVVQHDVTSVPFPVPLADLVYARYLLAHLAMPETCVAGWITLLRAGGRLLLEEVERIDPGLPVFERYLATVAAVMRDEAHDLYVGRMLDTMAAPAGARRLYSATGEVRPTTGEAARMFLPNLGIWRARPAARAHADDTMLDDLARELSELLDSDARGEIVWHMRRVVFERLR